MSPPAEKSKFVQTCNRLSLFLKESNIRDLNFGINAKFTETAAEARDLLSSIDDSVEKSANVPQQIVILDSYSKNKGKAAAEDMKKPMTIFYGGQVVVLDDVPADRARDLILIANNGKPQPNDKIEPQAKDSDLPIARRASLHKFLAKRKDRATVRASPDADHTFDLNIPPSSSC